MAYPSRSVSCRNCGAEYSLNGEELEFLAARGLDGSSGLCPGCRAIRRSQFASWNSGRGLSRSSRELHTAICADCGAETQIPFLPKEGRPVYCSTCFEKRKAAAAPPPEAPPQTPSEGPAET